MESSGPRSQLGSLQVTCNIMSKHHPSRSRRRSSFLQGTTLMVVLVLATQFDGAASVRNESIIVPDTAGAWDMSFKANCSRYRQANASSYFYYWPEDDPHFKYCCAFSASNYTYGKYGHTLSYAYYFDLGPIDDCLPFWKCTHLFKRVFETSIWTITCELTDLEGLYSRRFWKKTLLLRGLLQSALPFLFSLEIFVVLSVAIYWFTWRRPVEHGSLQSIFRGATGLDWLRAMHKTLLADWVHICLLAVIGNGLIEAMGHQDPYSSESKSFYDYARLYIILSALVWFSSYLQQLSYWISEIEDHYPYQLVETPPCQLSRQTSASKELKSKIGLDADWKWQPVGAQAGILFCLWGFLTNVGSKAQGVLGLVVAAAGPWSGLYALRVIVSCVCFHVSQNKRFKRRQRIRPRIRGLWRAVVNMRKVRGWNGTDVGEAKPGTELCDAHPKEPSSTIALQESV